MLFATDTVALSGARVTRDGYLVADARIARCGVYEYSGSEVGRPDLQAVRVYRSADTVFAKDVMATFANRPMTLQHPVEAVDASNWKKYSVGYTGEEVARDGDFVRVPLIVTDADAVSAIQAGTRELSCGYECAVEFKDGIAPDGTAYQAVMTGIKGNHVAIVDRGRAGHACRVGDDWKSFNAGDKGKPGTESVRQPLTPEGTSTMTLRKIQVDGLTIETTDAGAEAITKRDAEIAANKAAIADAAKALATATDAVKKLKEDHAKEIADLTAKIPSADALEGMLKSRSTLIDTAKKLLPDVDYSKLSAADVRKVVVAKKLGEEAVKDKSAEHIAAQFDTLALLAGTGGATDPVRDAINGGLANAGNQASAAYTKMCADQANAWAA